MEVVVAGSDATDFAEHQPGDQVQPPVDTYAMMSYDDDFLYVAFMCYDDPAEIAKALNQDRSSQKIR